MLERGHVDLVDFRPLLAIDFDVHEELVHERGRRLVFEAFVRHDMAPMAGGVSDGEQDRFVGALGLGKSLRRPRPPVNRVILVLDEVRTGLVGKTVFRHEIF